MADEQETGFRDVSAEAEIAAEDTEAQAVVAGELSHRATAAANGGGPWPEELVREQFVGAGQSAVATLPEYTSHEDDEASKRSTKKK